MGKTCFVCKTVHIQTFIAVICNVAIDMLCLVTMSRTLHEYNKRRKAHMGNDHKTELLQWVIMNFYFIPKSHTTNRTN